MPFSWVYFLPENSKTGYQFLRKILTLCNILPGNRPNFVAEHVTKTQNQSYVCMHVCVYRCLYRDTPTAKVDFSGSLLLKC